MKYTYASAEDKKRKTENFKYEYAKGDGSCGTEGNPDNSFRCVRYKMHELKKEEKNPLVVYKIESTNY